MNKYRKFDGFTTNAWRRPEGQPDPGGEYVTAEEMEQRLETKQNKLTAGDNIAIENDVISAVVPSIQTEGSWAYRIYDDNTFEAWFKQTGVSCAITETSGGWYRSEQMSLAAPQALYDAYDLDIAFANVQVSHNNFPVTCSSPTFYATGVNYYVLSGNTRPQTSNYTLTCYMRGTLTPKS